MQEKEDLRITKTREKLTHALSILAQKKSPEDITVTELCRQAGINRATFYKYYTVPADVGRESFERHIEDLLRQIHAATNEPLRDTMRFCCRRYQENYLLTKQIFPGFTISAESIQAFYVKLQDPGIFPVPERMYFIAGGTAAVVNHWLTETPDIPSDRIADQLTGMIQSMMAEAGPIKKPGR